MKPTLLHHTKNKIKKLKFLDWTIIALGLAGILIFGFIFFRKSTYITATVKVGETSFFYGTWLTGSPIWNDTSGTKNWFARAIKVGQSEKDGLGKVKAEVLDIYSYDKTPTRKTVYLTVRLNVVYNKASNTYTYKGVPVLTGSQIKLNLDNMYIDGLVLNVEGYPEKVERKLIKILTQIREESAAYPDTAGTKPYVAEAINIGDSVLDNNGNTLIKVVDKKVVLAKKSAVTRDGRVVETVDPTKRDVFLTLDVYAQEIDGKFYFLDDIPILIDQILPVNTDKISIFPIITRFLSIN